MRCTKHVACQSEAVSEKWTVRLKFGSFFRLGSDRRKLKHKIPIAKYDAPCLCIFLRLFAYFLGNDPVGSGRSRNERRCGSA